MTNREHYVKVAQELIDYLGLIEPAWGERCAITQQEFGLDALQTIGAYVGYVLENGLHTSIPRHPFFEPGVALTATPANAPCPVCGKNWSREYAGQPVCSNTCAKVYYSSLKVA